MPKNKTLPLQIYNFFLYFSPIGQFFKIFYSENTKKNIGKSFIFIFSTSVANRKNI